MTPSIRVLAASKLSNFYLEALGSDVEVIGPIPESDLTHIKNPETIFAIAGQGESKVPAVMMAALPNLKVVSIMGVGYDGVDIPSAISKGAKVGHTPGVLNDDVADLAIALMLNVTRGIVHADSFVRSGHWSKGPIPLATKLSGLRLGIVGMGRIGLAIADRARAFKMPIEYTARSKKSELTFTFHANVLDLAKSVDVLVIITPGGASTHHMINSDVLEALGSKGFLINVARGSVVDEEALVYALQNKVIAGAGLDVFEDEPRPLAALLEMTNVVVTPHIGSSTEETRRDMANLAARNLLDFLKDGRMHTPIPECQV